MHCGRTISPENMRPKCRLVPVYRFYSFFWCSANLGLSGAIDSSVPQYTPIGQDRTGYHQFDKKLIYSKRKEQTTCRAGLYIVEQITLRHVLVMAINS